MFCTNCGSNINDDAKFCGSCGQPVLDRAEATVISTADEPKVEDESKPVEHPQATEAAIAQTEASNASENPQQEQPKGKRGKKIAIICAIVAAIIVIASIVGYNLWSAEQERVTEERRAEIQALVDQMAKAANQIQPNTGEGADRPVLLEQYITIDDAKKSILDAEAAGTFELPNGTTFDLEPVIAPLNEKLTQIHDWFVQSYEALLAAASFPGDATADNTSSADCQSKIDTLNQILKMIEQEKVIWGDQTGEGSEYATLIADINAQIAKGNELMPAITAREEAERQKAEAEARTNGFIGTWGMYWGMGGMVNFHRVKFNANGTGESITKGLYTTPFTWTKNVVSDNVVNITTSGGDTYVYNISDGVLRLPDGAEYERE